MSEVSRYLLFGLVFFVLLVVGMMKNSDLICYLSTVVLGPWLFGLFIGVILKVKERDGGE